VDEVEELEEVGAADVLCSELVLPSVLKEPSSLLVAGTL